jgi:hypothetical protein
MTSVALINKYLQSNRLCDLMEIFTARRILIFIGIARMLGGKYFQAIYTLTMFTDNGKLNPKTMRTDLTMQSQRATEQTLSSHYYETKNSSKKKLVQVLEIIDIFFPRTLILQYFSVGQTRNP